MVAIVRRLYASQISEKKIQVKKNDCGRRSLSKQANLVDFSLVKSYNEHYKYILVVIDVFSKKAFTAYLKTKTSTDMIKAFERVMSKTDKLQKLQTDMRREFLNRPFQSWLRQDHIEHSHTQNFDNKATIAERFIRILKERFWRYFTYNNTRRYVEVLPALFESYNNTYHRVIGRARNSVNAENQEAVWLTFYADPELRKPKLKSRLSSQTVHGTNALSQSLLTWMDRQTVSSCSSLPRQSFLL